MVIYTEDSKGGYQFWKMLGEVTGKFRVCEGSGRNTFISKVLNAPSGDFGNDLLSEDIVLLHLDEGVSEPSTILSESYLRELNRLQMTHANLYEVHLYCFEQLLLSSEQTYELSLHNSYKRAARLLSCNYGLLSASSLNLLKKILFQDGIVIKGGFSPEKACEAVYRKLTADTCLRFTKDSKHLPVYWRQDCCWAKDSNNYTCQNQGISRSQEEKYLRVLVDSILHRPCITNLSEQLSLAELLQKIDN